MLALRSATLVVVLIVLATASCRMPSSLPEPPSPQPPAATSSPDSSRSADPAAPTGVEKFTPLIIKALAPDPVPVTGTDGKVHVVYELEVLNAAPRPATITSVETLSGGPAGPVIAALKDAQVVALSILVGDYALPPVPAKTVPPGRTVLLILEAIFADRASVPASLAHRLTATFGAFEPNQGDFATNNFPERSTEVGGEVTIGKGQPVVVGPPLSGNAWVAVNACCGLSPHRGAMVPIGGRINGAERYAVDWSRFDLNARPIVDFTKGTQATFRGDPTKNESYFTFGQPVRAVADGTVVAIENDLPEAKPHTFLSLPLSDLGGNRIVLKISDGVYAFYAHLKTGSITVQPGDVVKRGDQIAQAGNSGNTSESHLHFHVMDGPQPLTATNIPWELDSFTFEGMVDPETVDRAGAGARQNQLPLINTAIALPE